MPWARPAYSRFLLRQALRQSLAPFLGSHMLVPSGQIQQLRLRLRFRLAGGTNENTNGLLLRLIHFPLSGRVVPKRTNPAADMNDILPLGGSGYTPSFVPISRQTA